MNDDNRKGMGFVGFLQLALIILKLCGVLKWSWWVVLFPLWIELLIVTIILIAVFLINRGD